MVLFTVCNSPLQKQYYFYRFLGSCESIIIVKDSSALWVELMQYLMSYYLGRQGHLAILLLIKRMFSKVHANVN